MSKKNIRKSRRSGNQECPICECTAALVEHHLNGRDVPRWNEPWNIAAICPNCHDKTHLGDVIIEGWFSTTKGRELIWRLKDEPIKICEGCVPPDY